MDFIQNGYYNHCGIVLKDENGYKVIAAENTVKIMKLSDWLKLGEGEQFFLMRPVLPPGKSILTVIRTAKRYLGRVYDYSYQWDDQKIYNAELIWKAFYKGCNIYPGSVLRVDQVYITPENAGMYQDLKNKIPMGREVVTIEAIMQSSYLRPVLSVSD